MAAFTLSKTCLDHFGLMCSIHDYVTFAGFYMVSEDELLLEMSLLMHVFKNGLCKVIKWLLEKKDAKISKSCLLPSW